MRYLLIAGGRNYTDRATFDRVVLDIIGNDPDTVIVEGGAPGADTMAREYAISHGLEHAEFRAEWGLYGRAAGPVRNDKMTAYTSEKGGSALFFWDGKSRGTAQCIRSAQRRGLPVRIWDTVNNRFMEDRTA